LRRLVLSLVSLGLALAAAFAGSTTASTTLSPKLRADLAALVSGATELDTRIPGLVAGYQAGEIPYFAVLAEPNDAAHRAQLTALGARVLREYASVDAFALASDAATVSEVAALPWVDWLAPVEVVAPLSHQSAVGEPRNTPSDVGAPPFWNAGVTGTGVRIAVLDTGLDPAHQDLDDRDFRHWLPTSPPFVNPPKVVDSRNFVGSSETGACETSGSTDLHGHGTHVAGIATGTGEGAALDTDDGKHAGIAPGAELAVGKVMTDAGAGLNSDLITAMEWAALPEGSRVPGCLVATAIGADIVNLSLGSEARPTRLNSDSDVDLVSLALNRLAVRYGTLFVAAAGNSGPYIGSVLEAPGSAAQALSVAAAAKDYDVNHDDTLSGDTCAGWRHPPGSSFGDNDCNAGVGDQPPSVSSFSSRGPSGDVWLRPDLAAPGYNIVSAQAAMGAALAANDINRNTLSDPLYATATGTSMAAPAAAGSAALLLDAYRRAFGGSDPTGASGVSGLTAPTYALLRAALMNSAGADLFESRWILTTAAEMELECPPTPDPLLPTFCGFGKTFTDLLADGFGSFTLYEVRNGSADPYVGPLGEGAGKLRLAGAIAALRNGLVIYSAASGTGAAAGTGHRDLQGSWQVGAIAPGSTQTQRFVLRTAPAAGPVNVSFSFAPGQPSDGSTAIPAGSGPGAWAVRLPGRTSVGRNRSTIVSFSVSVPSSAPAGTYTGAVVARVSNGQTLRIPVFASVPLHDPNPAAGNVPGPQARIVSADDVFAKDDTTWPSAAGTPGTGANADWLVYPVDLASRLDSARFAVYDSHAGDETYDLYLYDARLDLIATTHPFVPPETESGVTNQPENDARGPTTEASPQELLLTAPAGGRYYLAVNRAKVGGTSTGDLGSFVLTLDEVRAGGGGGGGGGGCGDDEDDDLSVAGPATASRGGGLTYEIAYTNGGSDDDEDCELEDELDDDTDFDSASAGGVYDPVAHVVRWKLGPVPAGATVRVLVTATVSPDAAPGAVLLNRALLGGGLALPPLTAFRADRAVAVARRSTRGRS
jgi:subtilisin family serine protease